MRCLTRTNTNGLTLLDLDRRRRLRSTSRAWSLAALFILSSIACHAPAHESAHPTALTAPTLNRDHHGEPDVQKYISRLQSAERVADLQVDKVIEKLALPADATIGDLGCGPGIFTLALAKACPRGVVYASDIEPAQLDRVRAAIAELDLHNVVPVLASYGDPHFPPGRLDVVLIADTYHHLDDRVAYMQRLQNTLKPSGRLVILEYKPGKLPVGPPPEHKLKEGELVRELVAAGYTEVERFDTHPNHDFVIWRVLAPWERRK